MNNDGGYNPDAFLDFSQYNITPTSSSSTTTTVPSTTMSFMESNSSTFFNNQTHHHIMDYPPYFGYHHPHDTGPMMFSSSMTGSSLPPSSTTPPFFSPASLGAGFLNTPTHAAPLDILPPSSSFSLQKTFKASPPSTPSPPSASSTPSPPSSLPTSGGSSRPPSAKRKRTTKEDLMKVNTSIKWEDYTPPDTTIVQLLENLIPVEPFGIQIGHIDKNAIVEPDKCIIYRQNQFKLQCTLTGSLKNYTTPFGQPIPGSRQLLGSLDGRLYEVDGLFLKMYAFKQNVEETTEEFKVPIHQVGPSRTKKETKPPEVMPLADGSGFFDKLQFQASTHVGSESYFRIVVSVVARIQEKFHVVAAKISPKLLVRAQNPGRYNPNNPNNQKVFNPFSPTPTTTWHNNSPPSDHSNEEYEEAGGHNTPSPPSNQQQHSEHTTIDNTKDAWIQDRDILYYYGRVGINTKAPQEALTVHGNMMVTGDIFKPSDRRLKTNFAIVNPASQLNAINKINIYDYDIQAGSQQKRERGVIAQEVAEILPEAVQQIGDYSMEDGQEIEDLLVVNERMLLMENIGATQHLDRVLQEEREELNFVNTKVEELEQEEKKKSSYVMKTIQNMGSLIMSEDFREAPRSEWIYCGFSICGLGPAWSVFVMGFFFAPAWFFGSLYVSSVNPVKRAAGIANLLMLAIVGLMLTGMFFIPDKDKPLRAFIASIIAIGIAFLIIVSCYKRKRERLRQKVLKNNLKDVIRGGRRKAACVAHTPHV